MNPTKPLVFVSLLTSATLGAAFFVAACGSDSTSSGTGTFPNISTAGAKVVPTFGTTTAMNQFKNNLQRNLMTWLLPEAVAAIPSGTYDSDSDFTTAIAATSDLLLSVFGPSSGPVTRISAQLSGLQGTVEMINSTYADSTGEATGCTAIAAGTSITTPFFGTNGTTAIVTPSSGVTNPYKCYFRSSDNATITLFGRVATTATAGCTDAYDYSIMQGSSSTLTNTSEVATRGATTSVYAIKKASYNGCTKDLKLIFAHYGPYASGVEFTSRFEIDGNIDTRVFKLRVIKKDVTSAADATAGNFSYTSFIGYGKNQKTSDSDTDAYFAIGYNQYSCTSSSCTTNSSKNYCIKNSGTANTYSNSQAGTGCSSHATTYQAMTEMPKTAVPTAVFSTANAAFGL